MVIYDAPQGVINSSLFLVARWCACLYEIYNIWYAIKFPQEYCAILQQYIQWYKIEHCISVHRGFIQINRTQEHSTWSHDQLIHAGAFKMAARTPVDVHTATIKCKQWRPVSRSDYRTHWHINAARTAVNFLQKRSSEPNRNMNELSPHINIANIDQWR